MESGVRTRIESGATRSKSNGSAADVPCRPDALEQEAPSMQRIADQDDGIDWAEFFALYRTLALRMVRGLAPDAPAAEDLVQEAARALIEHDSKHPFESREHARNWYLRCAKNLAISGLRHAGRTRVEALPEGSDPAAAAAGPVQEVSEWEAAVARMQLLGDVRRELGALTASEREAVELRYVEGLAYREIADRTGKAISTLQARVEVGLGKIRVAIGKRDIEA
jgi:RNA polymerase sigma factor (sigma-70 family)